ncbi:MarR family transcriptional regulator [Archangium violaceum]|uniref:MarR family winged helix-turn-helix transcriptional regulator n=1 Tax=Archangium violaceum TaxID=83451 RepID=UPI002B2F5AE4|nr:MarR family transcriptional regulator [Archangium violaceum]
MRRGLGTQLRHLLELLDGAVAQAYEDAGLDYRPRYTPVMRVLQQHDSASIGQIAAAAGITQPAATQTVALMKKEGLVSVEPGEDGRQRLVCLTRRGRDLLPGLEACWAATRAAADNLDAELPFPLSQCLADAIDALETKSFGERIREARAHARPAKTSNPKAKDTWGKTKQG